MEAKETNPKDAIAGRKLPLNLVPDTVVANAALAFLEGALKYGQFNWRIAGARASVYLSAFKRHAAKWNNGEWADEKTHVPHLASMIACLGIILDAQLCGTLIDDRPPMAPIGTFIDTECEYIVAHLQELFKAYNPYQWTIEDSDEPSEDLAIGDTEFPDLPIPFVPVDMGNPESSIAFHAGTVNVDPTPPESYTEPKSWGGAAEYDGEADEAEGPDTQRSVRPPEPESKTVKSEQYCGRCEHDFCICCNSEKALPAPEKLPAWRYDVTGREIKVGDELSSSLWTPSTRVAVEEIKRNSFYARVISGPSGYVGDWNNQTSEEKTHLRIVSR